MRSNRIAVFVLSVFVAAVGCHKRVPIATQPTVPAPSAPSGTAAPPPTPAPAPVVPIVSPFDQAERAFTSGNYEEAARAYEIYLRMTTPGTGQRDRALYNLAFIYARPAPAPDWQRTTGAFRQLIDEFPDSPLKPHANLILAMRAELDQAAMDVKQRDQKIKQLTTELDRLKKIDADRRKRP